MSRCPTCKVELEPERIGGHHGGESRLVLLCGPCRRVFPYDSRPRIHLVTADERRKDLA